MKLILNRKPPGHEHETGKKELFNKKDKDGYTPLDHVYRRKFSDENNINRRDLILLLKSHGCKSNFYDKNLDNKEVNTTTLDQIVKKNGIPFPDFIKIDTQGSEIDILKGGNTILKNCSIIYLECPIIEYNLGAPSFSEYTSYMNSIGYSPYEICEIHHVDKLLVQIDILFLKTSILKIINPNKKILNIFK